MAFAAALLAAVAASLPSSCDGHAVCGADPNAIVEVSDTLALAVCTDSILRVVRVPQSAVGANNASEAMRGRKSLMVDPGWVPKVETPPRVKREAGKITLDTGVLRAIIDQNAETITFMSQESGRPLLAEKSHQFSPTANLTWSGKDGTYSAVQSWIPQSRNEALFGGGEYQNGYVNYRNAPVKLVQFNTEAVVPFWTSTLGYGILFDNNGRGVLNSPAVDGAAPIITSHAADAVVAPGFCGDFPMIAVDKTPAVIASSHILNFVPIAS